MSETFELQATIRSDEGKGASRRLRKTNHIPGVVYGDNKPAQSLTFNHDHVIKVLENEAFYSHIITLRIDGKTQAAVLKDLQRHEYKPKVLHMDFLRVNMKEKITMHVPLHFINEDQAPGVIDGGVVSHILSDVAIECLPADLPEYLTVDLSKAELDHALHLSDIQLPKGVVIVALTHGEDHDETIATIHKPRAVVEEEPISAEETATPTEEKTGDEKPEESAE